VERDGGPDWVPVLERSWGVSESRSWSQSENESGSETESSSQTRSVAEMLGWSRGRSDVVGGSTSTATSRSEGQRVGAGLLPRDTATQVTVGAATTKAESRQSGQTSGESGGRTDTRADQHGTATQHGTGRTDGCGGGDASSRGWSLRYAQVKRTVRESQATGRLRKSVADQLEEFAAGIFGLRPRHAYVLMGSECHHMEAIEVPDAFPSSVSLVRAVEWVRRELAGVHAYAFTPDLTPEVDGRRLHALFGPDAGKGPRAVGEENPIA
jgi:hypothetical protein